MSEYYICPICKEVVEAEDVFYEYSSATYYEPAVIERRTCCGGADYEPAYQCDHCGEWFTEDELGYDANFDRICECCREEIEEEEE